MKLIIILLATIISLLIPLTTYADSGIEIVGKTGNGTWAGNTWNVSLYPSESKSTTITLYNSSCTALGIEVSVEPVSFDGGNLAFELDKSIYMMGGNTYSNITLIAKANGSLAPGQYSAELTIKSEHGDEIPYIPFVQYIIESTPTPTVLPGPTDTLSPTPTVAPTVTSIPIPAVTLAPSTNLTPTLTPVPAITLTYHWNKTWLWFLLLTVPCIIVLVALLRKKNLK